MTESDLQEARNAVRERVKRTRRRDRLRTVAVGAAAAVALAAVGATAFLTRGDDATTRLAGPGQTRPDLRAGYLTGSPPTAQLVEGIWRLDNGEIVVKFDKNGTVWFDDHGTLFSHPATTGTYAIDGDLITVTITDDDQAECIGTEFEMRASLPEPGAMRYVPSDTAGVCSPLPSGQGALEQVLPTSRSLASLALSEEQGWMPLANEARLSGVWLAEGGGHVLEMDPDGSYYVADDSGEPIDVGQWSLRGADLTLTSSARSTTCSDGDQLVLGAVEWVDPGTGTRAFRGTIKQNACGGAWTPTTWILIPHARS